MELYPKIYLSDVQQFQGNLFAHVQELHPTCNMDEFVRAYFLSQQHRGMDWGNPHFLCLCGKELYSGYIAEGLGFQEGMGYLNGTDMRWIGEFYARYQWECAVKSEELLRQLPPIEAARIYPTFHTFSIPRAVEEAQAIYDIGGRAVRAMKEC